MAHVTTIGSSMRQVEYRLTGQMGCTYGAGPDAEREGRKGMRDKIADDGSDPDRREARGRIAADHKFESVECASQRRSEGAVAGHRQDRRRPG